MTQDEITAATIFNAPEYSCPVHGDIGNQTISSTINGFEMNLCLRCYLEKMVEIGVCKVTKK